MMPRRPALIATAVLLVLLLFAPQLAPLLHLATSIFTSVVLYTIAAMAVNLLVGYSGVLPFGNAAFFGLGAYGAGLAIKYFHVGFFTAIAIGIVAGNIMQSFAGMPNLKGLFVEWSG